MVHSGRCMQTTISNNYSYYAYGAVVIMPATPYSITLQHWLLLKADIFLYFIALGLELLHPTPHAKNNFQWSLLLWVAETQDPWLQARFWFLLCWREWNHSSFIEHSWWGGALGPFQIEFLRVILETEGLSLYSLFSSGFEWLSQKFKNLSLVILKSRTVSSFLDLEICGGFTQWKLKKLMV